MGAYKEVPAECWYPWSMRPGPVSSPYGNDPPPPHTHKMVPPGWTHIPYGRSKHIKGYSNQIQWHMVPMERIHLLKRLSLALADQQHPEPIRPMCPVSTGWCPPPPGYPPTPHTCLPKRGSSCSKCLFTNWCYNLVDDWDMPCPRQSCKLPASNPTIPLNSWY